MEIISEQSKVAIERTTSGKFAKSLFMQDFNDIDIFVEDTDPSYCKIYTELLKRVLGTKYKFESIFALGDSEIVLKKCTEFQEYKGKRAKLFIIDGDLKLLNGDHNHDLKGLYVLPRYCIENFFIDEEILITVAHEEDDIHSIDSIKAKLEFSKWKEENKAALEMLFIIYSICFKFYPEIQTVKYKVDQLCKDGSGVICSMKIQKRIDELKIKLLEKISIDKIDSEIQLRVDKMKSVEEPLFKFVSGKDYLFPLIKKRIRSMFNFSPKEHSLKNRLSMRCNVDELLDMEHFIMSNN